MFTLTTRPATTEEQKRVDAQFGLGAALTKIGCAAIFFGVLPAFGWGMLGHWLGGFISPDAAKYGLWIGCGAAAIFFIAMMVAFVPFERRSQRRLARDRDTSSIEMVHVTQPRVVEIIPLGNEGPVLVFEIGDNKLLFLQGQWLLDEDAFGAKSPEDDSGDDFINGLPAPNSFPSTEFTVTRWPKSGTVLGIRVAGEYLKPEAEVDALKPGYEFGDSELLAGSLADIASALAREHAKLSQEIE